MIDPFIIKVLFSLILGIIWVVVSTHIAENISGRIGGLIVGLPSTAVISIMFVGLTQGLEPALTAAKIVPFSSGLYCFYFLSFLYLSKRSFKVGFISSLLVWFLFAILSSLYSPNSLITSIVIWIFMVTASITWAVKKLPIKQSLIPKKKISSSLGIKALLTGGVISSIVIISKLAGAKWGGIFATFPAMTISTMLLSVKAGGTEYTRLIAKNVLISTTTTISLFAIFCYLLYPLVGIVLGTVLSYVALLVISIPLYNLVFDKLK
jgi:uncharacterized membrane protein (GlpM family)